MTQQEIKRRTLAKGAAWATPLVLASSQIPAYASSSTSPDSCEYGKIVSAPWFSPWPVNYNGSTAKEIDWAVYPTSNCSSAQALSINNSFPKAQAGAPTGSPASTYWPPTYPSGGSTIPDYSSVSRVNGVGAGDKIYVTIENVAGDVNYIDTPTGDDRFIFSNGSGVYSSNGTRGSGANVPMIRLNDDFKGYKDNPTTFSYLRFSQAPIVTKTSAWTWGYGDHYTTAEGRDGWRWEIESAANIVNGNAGAAVVSFMTRLPAAQYGDSTLANSKVIPVQYRVTVTSPWGVVTYLSDAV